MHARGSLWFYSSNQENDLTCFHLKSAWLGGRISLKKAQKQIHTITATMTAWTVYKIQCIHYMHGCCIKSKISLKELVIWKRFFNNVLSNQANKNFYCYFAFRDSATTVKANK